MLEFRYLSRLLAQYFKKENVFVILRENTEAITFIASNCYYIMVFCPFASGATGQMKIIFIRSRGDCGT